MPKTNSFLWLALSGGLLFSAQDKPRVFVSASESWEITDSSGGSRPNTVEILKLFRERCPEVTVTSDKSKADFSVMVDAGAKQSDKVAVFDKNGDLVFTGKTRFLRNAVKDACEAIKRERATRK